MIFNKLVEKHESRYTKFEIIDGILDGEFYDEGTIEHYNHWHDFASNNLFGIEINEQIARTAKMNMIIHDDGHTNVITSDGLEQIITRGQGCLLISSRELKTHMDRLRSTLREKYDIKSQ